MCQQTHSTFITYYTYLLTVSFCFSSHVCIVLWWMKVWAAYCQTLHIFWFTAFMNPKQKNSGLVCSQRLTSKWKLLVPVWIMIQSFDHQWLHISAYTRCTLHIEWVNEYFMDTTTSCVCGFVTRYFQLLEQTSRLVYHWLSVVLVALLLVFKCVHSFICLFVSFLLAWDYDNEVSRY